MRTSAVLFLTTLLIPTLPVIGQEKAADSSVYKVEFNIHDGSDAAAKTGRRYTIMIEGNEKGVFFESARRCRMPPDRFNRV